MTPGNVVLRPKTAKIEANKSTTCKIPCQTGVKPFEKFAGLMERNWSGVAAYCEAEEKFSLGFVEGVNTKIRVIQRRPYGLRDEEYLRLKVLTCMLPEI